MHRVPKWGVTGATCPRGTRYLSDPLSVKELALAYWTMSGALILLGGGRFTLGALLRKKA